MEEVTKVYFDPLLGDEESIRALLVCWPLHPSRIIYLTIWNTMSAASFSIAATRINLAYLNFLSWKTKLTQFIGNIAHRVCTRV
jgi:hypothetical protein